LTDQCFDRDNDKVARIVKGSPRISDISSDISNEMDGNPVTTKQYKDS